MLPNLKRRRGPLPLRSGPLLASSCFWSSILHSRKLGLRAKMAQLLRVLAQTAAQISTGVQRTGSSPAQLLQGPAGVPNLCHVLDLVALEFHDVDVIGTLEAPARRRSGTALARMGAGEDPVGANVLALLIDGERAHLVFAVGKNGQ